MPVLPWVRVLKAYFQDHYSDILKAGVHVAMVTQPHTVQNPGELDLGCTVLVDYELITSKDVPGPPHELP